MTQYTFRQGIVSYPQTIGGIGSPVSAQGQAFLQEDGNFINLLAANDPTVVHFAHKNTNYEFTESLSVNHAWDLTGASGTRPLWIYWDLNGTTGVRTFGYTLLLPITGPTQPVSPGIDQHWFDTVNNVMMVNTTGGVWVERIRVFAAQIASILPMGSNLVSPFAGSQVGLNNTPNNAGRILFDDSGLPVIRTSNDTFFTTEDEFFSGGSRINGIRLESDVVTANANANMGAYSVVQWTGFNTIGLANYNNSEDTTIGILTEAALLGENQTVIVQGVITNRSWNWPVAGAPLWVESTGVLVDADPNLSNSVTYPIARAPVARVLSETQIIFMQGLGSVGPTGPTGPAADQVEATASTLGNVFLSTDCGGSPPVPTAITSCDPLLAGAPFAPLSHLSISNAHDATNIDFSSAGNISSATVQAAIEELDGEKVAIAGDTMTGFLTLNADPTASLHAASKNYVDNLLTGLIWLDPVELVNMISDTVATAPASPEHSDAYIIAGTGGAWSSFTTGDVVFWDEFPAGSPLGGGVWVNVGPLATLVSTFGTVRFGLSFTSITATSGNFAAADDSIVTYISGGSPIFTIAAPVDNNAVFVDFVDAPNAFRQYVYNSQGVGSPTAAGWTLFGGGQLTVGSNLVINGNIIDVKQFSDGGTIDALSIQGSVPSDFALATHTHNYDLAAFLAGVAVVGDVVGSWILTRDLSFPINFTGSAANAAVPGTTEPSKLNILKNGGIVGTITFPTSLNAGVFLSTTVAGSPGGSPSIITTFFDGDLVTLMWGSPDPDPLLKNVSITIETCASAPSC